MTRSTTHALRLALLLGPLAAAAAPAPAQEAAASAAPAVIPDELLGLVGPFTLGTEDPALPGCPLTLSDRPAPGGWAIEVPEPCPAPYPPAAALVAWSLDVADGSILFRDAAGEVVLRLFEGEDGLYDTGPDTAPRFSLMAPYDPNGTGGEADE